MGTDHKSNSVVSIVAGTGKEPIDGVVDLCRLLLSHAKSGALRAISVQWETSDDDGTPINRQSLEGDRHTVMATIRDNIEQHAFELRMARSNTSVPVDATPPPEGALGEDDDPQDDE